MHVMLIGFSNEVISPTCQSQKPQIDIKETQKNYAYLPQKYKSFPGIETSDLDYCYGNV